MKFFFSLISSFHFLRVRLSTFRWFALSPILFYPSESLEGKLITDSDVSADFQISVYMPLALRWSSLSSIWRLGFYRLYIRWLQGWHHERHGIQALMGIAYVLISSADLKATSFLFITLLRRVVGTNGCFILVKPARIIRLCSIHKARHIRTGITRTVHPEFSTLHTSAFFAYTQLQIIIYRSLRNA